MGALDIFHRLNEFRLLGAPPHFLQAEILDASLNPPEISQRITHSTNPVSEEKICHFGHRCRAGFESPLENRVAVIDIEAEESWSVRPFRPSIKHHYDRIIDPDFCVPDRAVSIEDSGEFYRAKRLLHKVNELCGVTGNDPGGHSVIAVGNRPDLVRLCGHDATPYVRDVIDGRPHVGQVLSHIDGILELMSDTPGRLLSLLSLLQTPREWPGSELADRLEVSLRTIRRDVERLRDLGYPVQASMGAVGGYRLVAGKALPPLLLDDDEAVAIAVGLRTAAGNAIDGIEEASVRALTKLEQVLPSRLKYRVGALSAATVALVSPGGATVDPQSLTLLAAAIANHERVRFGYIAREDSESERYVEPHRLVAAGRRWYLVAFDNDRADWRLFRVDRVRDPKPTGQRTPPRALPAADAAAFVADKLYSSAPTYRAVVTLHLPIHEVLGRLGDSPGVLEPINEATCRLHSHADTLEWLAFRVAMLGCEFQVHEPPELIDYVRVLGARVSRAAG